MAEIKCSNEELSGLDLSQCQDRSAHSSIFKLFKGSLHVNYCGSYEAIYTSVGLDTIKGRSNSKALKKLVERLRADADFIEQNMIHDESTNQG